MTTSIMFYKGETWSFDGIVKHRDGSALDITGGNVEVRIMSDAACVLKSTSSDVTVTSATGGTYVFSVAADDSRLTPISDGQYVLEVDAIGSDGAVSVQNRLLCLVISGGRALFP